ncbi:MAG: GIY-YIG nuclease family protein [Burkholderiales bacterium]
MGQKASGQRSVGTQRTVFIEDPHLAYSFPSLNGSMIKVGKASGNIENRINQQLGTANPDAPTLLHVWSVEDIWAMETDIHSILKARRKWVEAPRAKE